MMKTRSLFHPLLSAFCAVTVMLGLSACQNNDVPVEDTEDSYDTSHYPEAPKISNGVTVKQSAIVLGTLPADFSTAVNTRFPVGASDVENAKIAVVDSKQLKDYTAEILAVYENQGLVIVANPDPQEVNDWFAGINLSKSLADNGGEYDLYAFSRNQHYVLEKHLDEWTVDENMNHFAVWVNDIFTQNIQVQPPLLEGNTTYDIDQLVTGQTFTNTYPIHMKVNLGPLAKGKSNDDIIEGTGQISCSYKIKPLFKYPNDYPQSDTGSDFYLVNATYSAENGEMTIGPSDEYQNFDGWKDGGRAYHNWINKHKGVYIRLCGFYMTRLSATATPIEMKSDGSHVNAAASFTANATPSPKTTQNFTSYSVQTSWNVNGNLSFGMAFKRDSVRHSLPKKPSEIEGSISLGGGFSSTTSKSVQVSDINVSNITSSPTAGYSFLTQNLPRFQQIPIRITDPPLISVSSANFDCAWIWEVPGVKVGSDRQFGITTVMEVEYGYCHFKTGPGVNKGTKSKEHFWIDPITPPNRTPSGLLQIKNTNEGESITNIEIWDTKNQDNPILKTREEDGSLSFGETFYYYLPVGDYVITFKKGKKANDTKAYKLAGTESVKIKFTETTSLDSSFNFIEVE